MSDTILKDIPIEDIETIENIRIENESLHELMTSMKQNGLQQPIGVFKNGRNNYILLFGSRRLESAKKLGWNTIPAIIRERVSAEDHMVINAIENIQRKDISPVELGRICYQLIEIGLSKQEVIARLGVPKGRIESSMLVYDKLPEEYREEIEYSENRQKTKKLGVTLVNSVLRVAKRYGMKKHEVKDIFDSIRRNALSLSELRVILDLIESGASVSESLKAFKKYDTISIKVSYKIDEMAGLVKKHKISRGNLLREIIRGNINESLELL